MQRRRRRLLMSSGGALVSSSTGFLHPAFTFSRASGATYSDTGSIFREVGNDVPRFTSSGLLMEGARTDLVNDPRTPFGSGWSNSGITSVASGIGPDGVLGSAFTVTESTAASTHLSNAAASSFTSGSTYSFSILAKAGTATTVQLTANSTRFGMEAYANFNLGTGALGTAGTAVTNHRIVLFANGFYWCQFSAPCASSGSASPISICITQTASDARAPSYTGTSRNVLVSYPWVEDGVFASNVPLPVTNGQASRVLETAIAVLSPLGLIPARGYAIYGRATFIGLNPSGGASQTLIAVDDDTASNRQALYWLPGSSALVAALRTGGGATSVISSLFAPTAGTSFGWAMGFDPAGRLPFAVNAGSVSACTAPAGSAFTKLRLSGLWDQSTPMFGAHQFIRIKPYLPSDAEIQSLSNAPA